jgi:hypothetical protein
MRKMQDVSLIDIHKPSEMLQHRRASSSSNKAHMTAAVSVPWAFVRPLSSENTADAAQL